MFQLSEAQSSIRDSTRQWHGKFKQKLNYFQQIHLNQVRRWGSALVGSPLSAGMGTRSGGSD
jgi:hypothetical protein